MISNRKKGNEFERDFCKSLSARGFWVHNMAQNRQGQPFDVIAVKDGKAYAFDCKVCQTNFFNSRRIEDNQRAAMQKWKECHNGDGYFAIKFEQEDEEILLPFDELEELAKERVYIPFITCARYAVSLERWLEKHGKPIR